MRITRITLATLCLTAAPVTVLAQALQLPEGAGKATTQKVCGSCHGAELLIGRQETRENWSGVVDDMIQRGATGTEDEFYTVVDYLATNFSPTSPAVKINVNKATEKDLQNALRLNTAEAAAIVKQRSEKGDFKSIAELEQVPGVDAKKIESSKNRLAF